MEEKIKVAKRYISVWFKGNVYKTPSTRKILLNSIHVYESNSCKDMIGNPVPFLIQCDNNANEICIITDRDSYSGYFIIQYIEIVKKHNEQELMFSINKEE